jgi:hypothetical protein
MGEEEPEELNFDGIMSMYGQMAESGPAATSRAGPAADSRDRVAPPQGNWRASPEYDHAAQYQTMQQQWDQNKPWANYEGGAMEWLGSPEVSSWTEPLDGVSQAIGGLIQGQNPLAAAAAHGSKSAGEALVERFNLPPVVGAMLDFIVPDPVGASRAADLVPLLGFLLPMRRAFSPGNRGHEVIKAIEAQNPNVDLDVELREPMIRNHEMKSSLLFTNDTEADIVQQQLFDRIVATGGTPNDADQYLLAPYKSANVADHQRSGYGISSNVGTPEAQLLKAYTDEGNVPVLGAVTGNLSPNAPSIFGTRHISDNGLDWLSGGDINDSSVYKIINRNLRRPIEELRANLTPRDLKAFQELVAVFDGIFDGRFKSSARAVGYRGSMIRDSRLPADIRRNPGAMIGQIISDAGYGSFSDEAEVAYRFLRTKGFKQVEPDQIGYIMQVEIPQGSPTIPMRYTSKAAGEEEILFPRQMRYRVVDIEPRSKYPRAPAGAVPADDVEYYFMLVEPDFSMTPPVTYRGPRQP